MIDRRLNVLRAIARHGTVTAAAEVCRLTPSAVSHQMSALARELDVALLEHVGRNVRLTEAAGTLLEHAEKLAAQWERAQADLATHREDELTGTLRLCGFSTAAAVVAPRALVLLRDEHPSLRLHLREIEPARAFDCSPRTTRTSPSSWRPRASRRGRTRPSSSSRCSPSRSTSSSGRSTRSRPATRSTSWRSPADPWIVGSPSRAYYQLVVLACTSAGFAPNVAHYADEWDTGAALVAAGFGVALVPRLAALPGHHDTRRIPIRGPKVPTRHVLAAIRAGSRAQPDVAAGLDALRRVCETDLPELAEPW